MDRIGVELGDVSATERTLLVAHSADGVRHAQLVTIIIICGTLIAAVLALLLNGLLTNVL